LVDRGTRSPVARAEAGDADGVEPARDAAERSADEPGASSGCEAVSRRPGPFGSGSGGSERIRPTYDDAAGQDAAADRGDATAGCDEASCRPAQPAPARAKPAQPPELALPFDAVLGMILYSPDRKLAIIDNLIVGVGDEVRGARVVEITSGAVMLRDAQGRLRRLAVGAGGR